MLKRKAVGVLRAIERHTKTDMVYLAKGGFWLSFGQVITAATSLTFSLIVARYVAIETYGLYKYAFSVAAIISSLSLTGLATLVVNRVARGDSTALRSAARLSIITAWPTTLAFAGYAGYTFFTNQTELAWFFILCSILQPISSAASLYGAHLNGVQDFRRNTLYWNYINATSIALTGIIAFLTSGFLAMAITSLATNTLGNCIAYFVVRPRHTTDDTTLAASDSTKTALHLSVMNILAVMAQHVDKIITFHFLGPSSTAIYAFASAMPDQIRAIFKTISRLAQPRLARRNFSEIKETLHGKILRASVLATMSAVAYILVAPYAFAILFPTYIEAVKYSQVLAISIVATLVSVPLTALQAHEKTPDLYKHTAWSSLTQIATTVLLVISLGLWGAVISTVTNRLLSLFLALRALRRAN